MDDGFLEDSSPYTTDDRREVLLKNLSLTPYTDIFDEQFPYYLAIGMTYDQFWNDDPTLVKAFRKAEEIKTTKANQMAWLQGRYIYDAILRVTPVIGGHEPIEYLSEAYPIGDTAIEKAQEKQEETNRAKAKQFMEMFAVNNNARFSEKGEEDVRRNED